MDDDDFEFDDEWELRVRIALMKLELKRRHFWRPLEYSFRPAPKRVPSPNLKRSITETTEWPPLTQ